jgi:hypothetical protein
VRTASERRAAGEAPHCDCDSCVGLARVTVADFAAGTYPNLATPPRGYAATVLRALVIATLLDPATWARPEGWRA